MKTKQKPSRTVGGSKGGLKVTWKWPTGCLFALLTKASPVTLSHPPQHRRVNRARKKDYVFVNWKIQGGFASVCVFACKYFCICIFVFHRLEGPGPSS